MNSDIISKILEYKETNFCLVNIIYEMKFYAFRHEKQRVCFIVSFNRVLRNCAVISSDFKMSPNIQAKQTTAAKTKRMHKTKSFLLRTK